MYSMTIEMNGLSPNESSTIIKVKKSKSKKSSASRDTQDAVTAEFSDGELSDDALDKQGKKEKKRKAKAIESGDATPVESKPEKERKKKKSKPEAETNDAMGVDEPATAEAPQSKAEKKKKRKREQESTQDALNADALVKEKKKKRKTETSEESTAATTPDEGTPSVSTSAERKKEKKSKKEKSKSQSDSSSSTTPVSSASFAANPSAADVAAYLEKHSITIHDSADLIPILSFEQLHIPEQLKSAFQGFKEPTPIQACAWPPALAGKDVVGIAETGSGKTLAFGIPALNRIVASSYGHTKPVALVVAPTRELAIQIHDAISSLGTPFNIRSVAVFGGVDKHGQIKALQREKKAKPGGMITRVVVGTPGRLIDLVNDGVLDLSEVHYLVLDEADRMLDKGFENDIRKIIGFTKEGKDRQTLMFSATWPDAVRRLAGTFQRTPVRITVGSDDLTANSRVEQVVEVFDDNRSKDYRLVGHLRNILPKKASQASIDTVRILVFALYKKEADRVEGMLRSKGFSVGGLHGDMNQNARMEALSKFKSGETPLLVATDVAARGLDIPNVAAVINYTFPLTIEDYIHRIGRTGRGGKSGKSITFFTGEAHERSLAGELARVLRESGFDSPELREKFPMTIKKKTHGVYGAFFRDDIAAPAQPTKIVF
ncbi:DEAD-domain-containing protein [Cristinia sonorae]|uniref:RNA helicase n=1 Tax=Cristinia sonorae TaxID=1940300 RepID=A0A8K0XRA1_9AGAR|nr:DEAD-domain-containing protein [Cristinia sonorae]